MDTNNFKSIRAGKVIKTDRDYSAFVPNALPPELQYSTELINLLAEANRHLGNLNGVGALLPNQFPACLCQSRQRLQLLLANAVPQKM